MRFGFFAAASKKAVRQPSYRRRILRTGDKSYQLQYGSYEYVPAQYQLRQVPHCEPISMPLSGSLKDRGMNKELQYLVYNTPEGSVSVSAIVNDETIWLTQKAMAELFGVEVPAISKHLENTKDTFRL